MNPVVLRCPNCGTTQATRGECEACHHERVGYFCANHAPGRWLDGPSCEACGATFGAAQRPATGPTRPRAAAPPTPPTPPTPPREVDWRPPPSAPPEEVEFWPIELPRASPSPRDGRDAGDVRDPREIGGAPGDAVWVPIDPVEGARVVARGALGCVGRLVMMLVILVVLAMLLLGGLFSGAMGFDQGRDREATREATHVRLD